ncbi:MAG: DNA alkylation repair protein [Nitrosopumilaceae archaeon]
MYDSIILDLKKLGNKEKAKVMSGFFKTGKGQYGEGDEFLGITVPEQRKIAKKYTKTSLADVKKLLENRIHECRLVALLILVEKFKGESQRKKIVDFYLDNVRYVNNWDLVDLSADKILGQFVLDKDTSILKKFAGSKNLWERRIAIVSTFTFIKQNRFDETLKISKLLISDKQDLIHKAVGWMLREVGKRNKKTEIDFLKQYYTKMPRTMLRYSIERFSDSEKKFFMKIH